MHYFALAWRRLILICGPDKTTNCDTHFLANFVSSVPPSQTHISPFALYNRMMSIVLIATSFPWSGTSSSVKVLILPRI
jgi:hypothetical protein